MKVDIDRLSDELAANSNITDYDFWRALKTLNNEIFSRGRSRAPIPMEFIHLRAVLRTARAKRHTARC